MNQLNTYNHLSDGGKTPRRYGGFPLNSTLVSFFSPDTIRSIITQAATGKPYTTAVWIRISRIGIQISAQDPQIARTRIPVFIPLTLVHDIFMQPSINNVICIVYDEVKSNMKGILLYVVHPGDAHLLRDDFRLIKQPFQSNGSPQQSKSNENSIEPNRLISPTSPKMSDSHRNGKSNRQPSPKRIVYIRDNETKTSREVTPTTAVSQLNYTPLKGSYHSNQSDNAHRRQRSPRKPKVEHSSGKAASENGRRKFRSQSPHTARRSQPKIGKPSSDINHESTNSDEQPVLLQQDEQIAAMQAGLAVPVVPMGIYNRYVPKAIPLPTGETIRTTLSSSEPNGVAIAHIEPPTVDGRVSPSSSRSGSSKHQEQQKRNRSSSAQNPDQQATPTSGSHQHHHHHHRHHHSNGTSHAPKKAEPQKYGTISHSTRKRSKYATVTTNSNGSSHPPVDHENDMKEYLKQLMDDMQAIKLEMNKIRVTSTTSTPRPRSDSLRVNLKELRNDIDAIRARITMTPKVA